MTRFTIFKGSPLPGPTRALGLAVLITVGLGGMPTAHALAPEPAAPSDANALNVDAEEATDRLIVRYSNSVAGREPSILSAGHPLGGSLRRHRVSALLAHRNALGAQVVKLNRALSGSEMRALAQAVRSDDSRVDYAEPDYRMQIQAAPNDPLYASQWDLFDPTGGMRVPAAWPLSTGNGVVVAVVDTGYRPHVDLAANLLTGYDFISDAGMANDGNGRDADASDPGDGCTSGHSSWHGTHVAGSIAAAANNGMGIVGVAYDAKILPVRVLGCRGGYTSDLADGVMWAAGAPVADAPPPAQAAKVINMSLGGPGPCTATMQTAISAARALGAVVVVAAGNSNTLTSGFSPANCAGVITVAANGKGGGKAPYSNYGPEVDVTAPGGNMALGDVNGILSTLNTGTTSPGDDSYAYYQGTSMAAPHASGAIALMLARDPSLTPDEIEVLLRSTARAFAVNCTSCGTGIVDAGAAALSVYLGSAPAAAASEFEPNDALAQAQPVTSFPSKVAGTMSSAADLDTYKVTVPPGSTLTSRLISNMASDYNLAYRNAAGTLISTSTRARGLTDKLVWKNSTAGNALIYVRVSRLSGGVGASAGKYWLEINR
jgi:serine protease